MARKRLPSYFAFILLMIGILISLWGYKILEDAQKSEDWPTVEGRVMSSKLKSHNNSRWNSITYSVQILFKYTVQDKVYLSDKFSFEQTRSKDLTSVRRIVDGYPAGKYVQLFYDPDNPGVAVLDPRPKGRSYVLLGVGIALGLIGFLGFLIEMLKRI